MCVVSKIENIVKIFICAGKKRALYQMYVSYIKCTLNWGLIYKDK